MKMKSARQRFKVGTVISNLIEILRPDFEAKHNGQTDGQTSRNEHTRTAP